MAEYVEKKAILGKAIKEKRFVFRHEDLLKNDVVFKTVYKNLAEFIESIPAADVAPVVHARWWNPKTPKRYGGGLVCSECKKTADWTYNYCPNCGAKMDQEG